MHSNRLKRWKDGESEKLKESYENKSKLEDVLISIDGRSKDSVKMQLYKLIESGFITKRNDFIKPDKENPICTKTGKTINGYDKKWWTGEEIALLREQWLRDMDFNIPDRTKLACNRKATDMGLVYRKKQKRDEEEIDDSI